MDRIKCKLYRILILEEEIHFIFSISSIIIALFLYEKFFLQFFFFSCFEIDKEVVEEFTYNEVSLHPVMNNA